MQRFTDLAVWKRSHSLVKVVYRLTAAFPADERYGLTSQLRRAAASVPTNIAEGSKRASAPDYARFLNISEGSLAETQYLLILSADLGLIPIEDSLHLQEEAEAIARMLFSLRQRVLAER